VLRTDQWYPTIAQLTHLPTFSSQLRRRQPQQPLGLVHITTQHGFTTANCQCGAACPGDRYCPFLLLVSTSHWQPPQCLDSESTLLSPRNLPLSPPPFLPAFACYSPLSPFPSHLLAPSFHPHHLDGVYATATNRIEPCGQPEQAFQPGVFRVTLSVKEARHRSKLTGSHLLDFVRHTWIRFCVYLLILVLVYCSMPWTSHPSSLITSTFRAPRPLFAFSTFARTPFHISYPRRWPRMACSSLQDLLAGHQSRRMFVVGSDSVGVRAVVVCKPHYLACKPRLGRRSSLPQCFITLACTLCDVCPV
jgi:hypothetical protein